VEREGEREEAGGAGGENRQRKRKRTKKRRMSSTDGKCCREVGFGIFRLRIIQVHRREDRFFFFFTLLRDARQTRISL